MDYNQTDESIIKDTIEFIFETGSNIKIQTIEEFNSCFDHIVNLISDSYNLYSNGSYSTSSFLSITAIEEIGKINAGLFVQDKKLKGPDPLRNHETKQIFGSGVTIHLSENIIKLIGKNDFDNLLNIIYNKKLTKIRNDSIYADMENNKIIVPEQIITEKFSRNILILAIGSLDDSLIGYSDHSMKVEIPEDILYKLSLKK